MTPEIEVLDQLVGGDLPLNVVARLFSDHDHCRKAVNAMIRAGDVLLLDAAGQAVPDWQYRELEGGANFWREGSQFQLSLTEAGARRMA